MAHYKIPALEPSGFVVLRDHQGPPIPEEEFLGLEYMDWKSGGDTNFAPLASALGEMECAGFWDHGKPDKDGVWTRNREIAPSLVGYVERVGARFGRVRVIKLNPYDSQEAVYRQLHQDDNNRLNPDGEGWVVRTWLELNDNPGAFFVLREKRDNPYTESRIPLHRGRQIVIDTERLWHVVCHRGDQPRYALITSFESGPALERWMEEERATEASEALMQPTTFSDRTRDTAAEPTAAAAAGTDAVAATEAAAGAAAGAQAAEPPAGAGAASGGAAAEAPPSAQ